jgi:hypothetical protein
MYFNTLSYYNLGPMHYAYRRLGRSYCIRTQGRQAERTITYNMRAHGGAVVEALRYKPESRGIDSRWCHWNFSLTQSFRPHYDPGVDSDSNRNEYQKHFLGVNGAGG